MPPCGWQSLTCVLSLLNFNTQLLQSTYVFGFIAGIFMTFFGVGLFFWRTPEVKKTVTY